MSKITASAIFRKFMKVSSLDVVIDGLGFGGRTNQVRVAEHPGGLWAVESGSTLLIDVSGDPLSEEKLDRLCKLRRSIAIRTAIVVTLGIAALTQLMMLADLAGLFIVAMLIAALFLASKVSAHEESRQYVVSISTDPSAIKNSIEGSDAKETAKAGAMLAQTLRQFAANEALVPARPKSELIARANHALRQGLPSVSASTLHNVNSDVTDVLSQIHRQK